MNKTSLWRWLLPVERFPREPVENYARAVGVLLIVGTASALMGLMGMLEVAMGGGFGWYMLAIVAMLLGIAALFRQRGGSALFGHLVVGVVIVGIGVLMALTGGRAIGGAMMMPLFVMLAVLVLPRQQGMWWAVVAVVAILVSYWEATHGVVALVHPDPEWAASAGYRVPIALSILGALFGLYFIRSYRELLAGLEQSRGREASLRRIASEQRDRFTDFALVAADWFWETDAQHRLVFVSPGFAEAFGMTTEEMTGLTPMQVARRLLPADEAQDVADPLSRRTDFSGQQLVAMSAEGERRVLSNSGRALWSGDGTFRGYRGAAIDITELQGLNETLRQMAETDSLTGLANRRYLARRLERVIGTPGWLLSMDLDGFKAVNDTHGHEVGDTALCQVAAALLRSARETDVVARLGGDEFAIVLPNHKPQAAEAVARRVLEEIGAMAAADPRFHGLGISIGLARLDDAGSVDEALRRADSACYAAKRAGRHRYEVA